MIDWLLDTLVWTGALIALVLLVRRAVARHLGAQAAYSLWLLPFARLFLPTIELPAIMAPPVDPVPVIAIDPVLLMAAEVEPVQPDSGWLWVALAFGLWLTGAAVMLGWRYVAYFRMRARLLEQAEQKLRIGGIRIVETPATASPLAFGIVDRVIAVPAGFLMEADTATRNLAIAHELAHHERGDLIANFAAQPLFALHWFNPLGWLGWRALRRDQEAACDARVVAQSDDRTRADYARTIARFSAGPDLALAAPMACPVLGEKSIIERLRSLKMADISPRRRWAGRAALVTGLIALPLTASFTYAAPGMAAQSSMQGEDEQSDTVVLREIDPDRASLTEQEAEELAEKAAAISAEMEQVADEIERNTILVYTRDGKILNEAEMERRAEEIDRAMERLEKKGLGNISVRMDLGEMRRINAEKLTKLEVLAKDMEHVKVRLEQDPEWQAGMRKLQELSLRMAEVQLPELLELQRGLDQVGVFKNCEKDGETVDCTTIDVRKIQRDALRDALREIRNDPDLTDEQRARALRAVENAMSQND